MRNQPPQTSPSGPQGEVRAPVPNQSIKSE